MPPPASLTGSDTSCNSESQTLDPAASCVLSIEFIPTASAGINGSVVLTDNALNLTAATQTIALQGTGLSLAPISPTVTFTGAPASAAYGATFGVPATANGSTTAVITASGACSIVGNTVTMTSGTGTCNLVANWAADNNYAAASLTQSTAATKAPLTVTANNATIRAGEPNLHRHHHWPRER